MTPVSLYQRIGSEKIAEIVHSFYEAAFEDGIIGHFFFGKDHKSLVDRQISFTEMLLGKQSNYVAPSMTKIHAGLDIRKPHFLRRQKILEEMMSLHMLDPELKRSWLKLESRLLSQIVKS